MGIKLPLEDTIVKFMSKILENRKITEEKAKENIKKAQDSQKKYYKQRKTANGKSEIKLGQNVLLYSIIKQLIN